MDAEALHKIMPAIRTVQTPDGPILIPTKAYRNLNWLNSRSGRTMRVMAEYFEPQDRLKAAGVENTILFFGSARSRSPEDHAAATARVEAALADASLDPESRSKLQKQKTRLERTRWMCDSYDATADLAERLTRWSLQRTGREGKVPCE